MEEGALEDWETADERLPVFRRAEAVSAGNASTQAPAASAPVPWRRSSGEGADQAESQSTPDRGQPSRIPAGSKSSSGRDSWADIRTEGSPSALGSEVVATDHVLEIVGYPPITPDKELEARQPKGDARQAGRC